MIFLKCKIRFIYRVVFLTGPPKKMTKCQITCKSLQKSSKCQNFLRVWHIVIFRADQLKKPPCIQDSIAEEKNGVKKMQELMCPIGGSAAPCLPQREGVDAFWCWRLQGLHVDVHRLQVRRLGGRGQLLLLRQAALRQLRDRPPAYDCLRRAHCGKSWSSATS